MDKQLIWQDRFNIGVDYIDKEHQKLFGILDKMIQFEGRPEKHQWICDEGLKYFKSHTMKHFAEEEEYMRSIGYEGYEAHKQIHENFKRVTLPELEKELEQTGYSAEAVNHFLGVCTGWLIGHTLTEDHAIVGGAESQWLALLPEDEQTAMKEAIIHLLYEMFRLESRVISERYGGEKFGQGIYYRMLYITKEGNEWEIFLVFEEKLLTSTIGDMMGVKSDKVNVMIMNAMRYSAKQFIERLRSYFPTADLCKLKEENLLNYNQFQKLTEKQSKQISLLFDTGSGYFAFCVSAPHLLESGIGSNIKAENAATEIAKYLEKNIEESRPKEKILVVDDSSVMRQAMSDLLGGDYDVAQANSGMSAIRSITLDRPDLVLLDYEMPVCDGRQVLDMIRAEEETADIPVIFLTGRGDEASIRKILPLKPAGYLLKSMKPAEIKKNVDKFFEEKNS